MLVALVDDAQHAVRAQGPRRRGRQTSGRYPRPTAWFPRLGIGADAILNLIGDAVAVVALVRLHHDVEAGLRVFRFEELRVAAAGRDRRDVAESAARRWRWRSTAARRCRCAIRMRPRRPKREFGGIEWRRRARRRARRAGAVAASTGLAEGIECRGPAWVKVRLLESLQSATAKTHGFCAAKLRLGA